MILLDSTIPVNINATSEEEKCFCIFFVESQLYEV